ncbi:IFI27 protein, partial [Polypterus senegalus]
MMSSEVPEVASSEAPEPEVTSSEVPEKVAGMLAVPTLLGAAGFTSAGIAAGSIGAKLMSASAIANGGGVAAGSLVATLQSAGTGLGLAGNALAAAFGSATASAVFKKHRAHQDAYILPEEVA